MATEDRLFPVQGWVGVSNHAPFWERLVPRWLGRRLGWKSCGRCGRTDRGVIFDRGEGRNLCVRCWALFVYLPRVTGKEM